MREKAIQQADTFISLPRSVCTNTELDWPAKVLWAEVYSFTRQGRPCWLSLSELADRIHRSSRQVSTYIGQLQSMGWLSVEGVDGRRRHLAAHLPNPRSQPLPTKPASTKPASTIEADRVADTKPASRQTRGQLLTNKKERRKQEENAQENTGKARPRDLAEVRAYFAELDCSDPDVFWDYWTSAGWRRKGGPIKDWRAAARTWARQPFRRDNRGPREGRKLDAAEASRWARS